MDLDRTFIAIRERRALDTLDLSLRVCRLYLGPLTAAMSLGAIPWALLNHSLIGWMLPPGVAIASPEGEMLELGRFTWTMLLLVTIEAPLASVLVTAYLGKAMFLERPRVRDVVREVLPVLPRAAGCHLLGRGVLVAILLALLIFRDREVTGADVLLALLCFAVLLRRIAAPFLSEILILERNPLRAISRETLTVGRRSRMLHRSGAGSFVNLALVSAAAASLLTLTWFGTIICARGILFDRWLLDTSWILVGVPLSLWLTALFTTVFRFLAYLDLRIRHEGWEVELRMRAEGHRLAGQRS